MELQKNNQKLSKTKIYFHSFINNKSLFETRKLSIIYPFLILILIIGLLAIPSYLSAKSLNGEQLVKNFPDIEKPFKAIFSSDLDCSVKDSTLKCAEGTPALNTVVGEKEDKIKYTVIVNQKTIALDTEVTDTYKDTDNIIILYSQTARIRYVQRDYVNNNNIVYEIVGDYSNLEGYSLKQISEKIANNPNSITSETQNFVFNLYQSTLNVQLVVNIASSIVSFLLLALVCCIVIKSTFLFKLKKGFKFKECFKIALNSAAPGLILSLLISLLFGFSSFSLIFGFVFMGRIIFIYFKYILNNRIFKELYIQEKEERFNI